MPGRVLSNSKNWMGKSPVPGGTPQRHNFRLGVAHRLTGSEPRQKGFSARCRENAANSRPPPISTSFCGSAGGGWTAGRNLLNALVRGASNHRKAPSKLSRPSARSPPGAFNADAGRPNFGAFGSSACPSQARSRPPGAGSGRRRLGLRVKVEGFAPLREMTPGRSKAERHRRYSLIIPAPGREQG
jgi:hypothetical protein